MRFFSFSLLIGAGAVLGHLYLYRLVRQVTARTAWRVGLGTVLLAMTTLLLLRRPIRDIGPEVERAYELVAYSWMALALGLVFALAAADVSRATAAVLGWFGRFARGVAPSPEVSASGRPPGALEPGAGAAASSEVAGEGAAAPPPSAIDPEAGAATSSEGDRGAAAAPPPSAMDPQAGAATTSEGARGGAGAPPPSAIDPEAGAAASSQVARHRVCSRFARSMERGRRPAFTRTTSRLRRPPILGAFSPFDAVRWRGDPSSFVDVFDVPILDVADPKAGARFASVVRLPYPRTAFDPEILEFDPGADFERARSGWARSVPAWRGGRALRMYDRGECSAAVSWRELGEQLAVGIDGALHGRGRPVGSWNLTYELVQPLFGDGDNFTFTRPYEVRVPDTELHIVVSFQITGQFTATDLQMGFRLIRGVVIIPPSVAGPGGEDPLSPEDAAMVEGGIEAGLVSALGQSLADSLSATLLRCTPGTEGDAACLNRVGPLIDFAAGQPTGTAQPHNLRCVAVNANEGECRFVPNVYRVNHRVDGVAVVLSETDTFTPREADPFYRVLEAAGACHGFRIDPLEPIACVHDAIIEPPPPGRSRTRFCGDALLTR